MRQIKWDTERARRLIEEGGHTDAEIAEMVGTSPTAFKSWKNRNRLTRARASYGQKPAPEAASSAVPEITQEPKPEAVTDKKTPARTGDNQLTSIRLWDYRGRAGYGVSPAHPRTVAGCVR